MAKKKNHPSKLTKALLETADDMRSIGVMDAATHQKITLRHMGADTLMVAAPISGEDIRALREEAQLSQAVFARYLNLTTGYISQLERGAKQPTGSSLALLNIVRHKGIETLL